MLQTLSHLLVEAAAGDPGFLALCADHGHQLFAALRRHHPDRFINVGIAEQAMIGVAAGLASVGFRPCVYGLASFVPMRVLEQIKIDLCLSGAPVILLGDGAGLVYSTLGATHQCGEDIACLRPLPGIAIYSPCDAHELRCCWEEARQADHPSYIRIGKADRPPVHTAPPTDSHPRIVCAAPDPACEAVIVATGAMVAPACDFARARGFPCISVPRLKPEPTALLALLAEARRVVVLEEHVSRGGLWSLVVEMLHSAGRGGAVQVEPLGLQEVFTRTAGDHQQALSEHGLDDRQLELRLRRWADLSSG